MPNKIKIILACLLLTTCSIASVTAEQALPNSNAVANNTSSPDGNNSLGLNAYVNTADQKLEALLQTLSPAERTALANRAAEENKVVNNPYSLLLYKPTYILPFYYTQSPYQRIYQGQTPDNQKVMKSEFKAQLSFQVPIFASLLEKRDRLAIAYTQDSFWQVYANSQYFRETNYEPEIFFRRMQTNQLSWQVGFVHQSNGRGGTFERSWNRVYGEMIYSGSNWVVNVNTWALVLKHVSSNLHNPDIADYMGNGDTRISYKFGPTTLSLMTRNNVQSRFKRGAEQLTFSFPLQGHFHGFVFVFSGFGQSLIEYDHYTNAAGFGIAFNDWI